MKAGGKSSSKKDKSKKKDKGKESSIFLNLPGVTGSKKSKKSKSKLSSYEAADETTDEKASIRSKSKAKLSKKESASIKKKTNSIRIGENDNSDYVAKDEPVITNVKKNTKKLDSM